MQSFYNFSETKTILLLLPDDGRAPSLKDCMAGAQAGAEDGGSCARVRATGVAPLLPGRPLPSTRRGAVLGAPPASCGDARGHASCAAVAAHHADTRPVPTPPLAWYVSASCCASWAIRSIMSRWKACRRVVGSAYALGLPGAVEAPSLDDPRVCSGDPRQCCCAPGVRGGRDSAAALRRRHRHRSLAADMPGHGTSRAVPPLTPRA